MCYVRFGVPSRQAIARVIGSIGGRIVDEVFIGFLQTNKDSFLSMNRN